MEKDVFKLTGVWVILGIFVLAFYPAFAAGIPGHTDEEIAINTQILTSVDEAEVAGFLSNTYTSVRKAACMRLGTIGTALSLACLEQLAVDDDNAEVREEAAYAYWSIRYRDGAESGADLESLLLEALGIEFSIFERSFYFSFGYDGDGLTPVDDGGEWTAFGGLAMEDTNCGQEHLILVDELKISNIPGDSGVGTSFIETDFHFEKLSWPSANVQASVYFGMDNVYLNSYVLKLIQWDDRLELLLEKLTDGDSEQLASAEIDGCVPDFWHSLRIEIEESGLINVEVDAAERIRYLESEAKIVGKVAFAGLYVDIRDRIYFDNISIYGVHIDRNEDSATKTARVRGEAISKLGDLGSLEALSLLEVILHDNDPSVSEDYLKRLAEESIQKITFIEDCNTNSEDPVEEGLLHDDFIIRLWALERLLERDPVDLEQRLQDMLNICDDDEFKMYLVAALERVRQGNVNPVDISYPEEGSIVKDRVITVAGTVFGRTFYETVHLSPGENTYTKSVTDADGTVYTESVTFQHLNSQPIFNAIGDKTAVLNQPLSFTVSAEDADDPVLLYFTGDLPDGATFDEETLTFSWTPDTEGLFPVQFHVVDTAGLPATEIVEINVRNIPFIDSTRPSGAAGGRRRQRLFISGENFGVESSASKVHLSNAGGVYEAAIYNWRDNRIYCNVSGIPAGEYELKVINSQGESMPVDFRIIPAGLSMPRIFGISSKFAVFMLSNYVQYLKAGEEAAISGRYFGERDSFSKIIVYNGRVTEEADIVSWSDDKIIFVMPAVPENAYYSLKVHTEGGWSNYYKYLCRLPPTAAPSIRKIRWKNTQPGALVTLQGYSFGDQDSQSKLLIANHQHTEVEPEIISWSDYEVSFRVPSLPDGQYYVKAHNQHGWSGFEYIQIYAPDYTDNASWPFLLTDGNSLDMN